MEKYYVTENDTHHDLAFCQNIKAQNKAQKTKDIILQYSMPKIPVGTKIKVYETANKDPLSVLPQTFRLCGIFSNDLTLYHI